MTLTVENDIHTVHALTLWKQDTLPYLETEEQDSNIDSEMSDQEFVDALDSADVRHKIQVCRQTTTFSPTRAVSGPDSGSLIHFEVRLLSQHTM